MNVYVFPVFQAAVNWPEAVHLAGDVQSTCVQKTKSNISSVNEKRLKINKYVTV